MHGFLPDFHETLKLNFRSLDLNKLNMRSANFVFTEISIDIAETDLLEVVHVTTLAIFTKR